MTWQRRVRGANCRVRCWQLLTVLALLGWVRACGDSADAWVATEAVQDAKVTLFVSVLMVGFFVWWWQHFNSGKRGGTG